MSEDDDLVECVARALRNKSAEIDQRPGVHEADPMWFADEYARAAIKALVRELLVRDFLRQGYERTSE